MNPFLFVLIAAFWIFVLVALRRAKIQAWHFLWGSLGLFLLLMLTVEPVLADPLAKCVSALAGIVGSIGDTFTAYFKYGIIFINAPQGALTLTVDFECSGVIEVLAFLSLLVFFDVYTPVEKTIVSITGFAAIMTANALRIVIICLSVHFFGIGVYYIVHTFVGRLFFYGFSVLLYFYVFTKPQVIKMKVGSFGYGHSEKAS